MNYNLRYLCADAVSKDKAHQIHQARGKFICSILVEVGGRISLSCQIETVNFPAFFYKYSHFEENETRAPSKLVNF